MVKTRVYVDVYLLDEIKKAFSETAGLSDIGVVDVMLRKLLATKEAS
ncbi:hypothetical protein ES708_22892 [subsurface metagenome]